MRRTVWLIIAIATLSGGTLCPQDIAGNGRETLENRPDPAFGSSFLPRADLQDATKEVVWKRDSSARFKSTFITVEKDVKLEVIDWGGSGRALILLAGLGANAHAFDQFAPK